MSEIIEGKNKNCPIIRGECDANCIFLDQALYCEEQQLTCMFKRIGTAADTFQLIAMGTDFKNQKDVLNNIHHICQCIKLIMAETLVQKTIKKRGRPMAKCKKKKPVKK